MWVATPRQRQSAGRADIARSLPCCDRDLSVVARVRPPKGPFGRIQAPDGTYAVDPGRTHITLLRRNGRRRATEDGRS